VATAYRNVFKQFIDNYYAVSELPLNRLNESTLKEAYIVDFEEIKRVVKHLSNLIYNEHDKR
jgi:hypothetical protein